MAIFLSPAKINLFLHILHQRQDGYHELASLFQAISIYDTLHLSFANEDSLTCTAPWLPTDENNLILKAADLFRKKTGLSFKLKAHLIKNIPHQAGLGGGSSNAATTLWALNEMLSKPASLEELIDWSAEIGSDITFFLSEGTAYCTGRGEKFSHVPSRGEEDIVIVKPQEGISTAELFKKFKDFPSSKRQPEQDLNNFLNGKPFYYNDLEPAATHMLPQLKYLKEQLIGAGYHSVVMTGSGSAFFCLGQGNFKPLNRDNIFCQKAQFIHRQPGKWYGE